MAPNAQEIGAQAQVPAQADSLASDSVAADTVSTDGMYLHSGIALEHTGGMSASHSRPSYAMSWVTTGLILLFVVACLRYRKNARYFVMLVNDLMEVRERHNAFDDTVRESSFLFLLNLLWCVSTGVLLYAPVCKVLTGSYPQVWEASDVAGAALCAGVCAAYTIFMILAYSVVGNVFSDPAKSGLWVKGYLSAQSLSALVMFPLALVGMTVPSALGGLLIVAVIAFGATKILFIYKGFRIFFTKTASWVLFLYYLCSLEIVPLVLSFASAVFLCGKS